jgi:hypothetical protein
MKTDFRRALARLVPIFMPELLFRLTPDGYPIFKEFAAAIMPTKFMPGKVFGTGTMKPIDYFVELAEGLLEPPSNLDIGTVQQQEIAPAFGIHIAQYLSRRAADWRARGFARSISALRREIIRSRCCGSRDSKSSRMSAPWCFMPASSNSCLAHEAQGRMHGARPVARCDDQKLPSEHRTRSARVSSVQAAACPRCRAPRRFWRRRRPPDTAHRP